MKPLIVFYDGPCVICNWWVRKLCQWDKKDQLRFANLDGTLAKQFSQERNLDLSSIDSVVVWDQMYSYALEAEASFMLFSRLGGFFVFLTPLSYLPKGLTNGIYRIIARNRYNWFGKYDSCPLPDPKFKHKFL